MAASRESIAFVKTVSCQIHESGSVSPADDRKQWAARYCWSLSKPGVLEITRGASVARKEEIDDLIKAFDRVVHEDNLNPERAG
jgi:hypothetical protein